MSTSGESSRDRPSCIAQRCGRPERHLLTARAKVEMEVIFDDHDYQGMH